MSRVQETNRIKQDILRQGKDSLIQAGQVKPVGKLESQKANVRVCVRTTVTVKVPQKLLANDHDLHTEDLVHTLAGLVLLLHSS